MFPLERPQWRGKGSPALLLLVPGNGRSLTSPALGVQSEGLGGPAELCNRNNRRLGSKQAVVSILNEVWGIGELLMER